MKKKYIKPMAFIENFEMSQHIAACQSPIKDKLSVITEGCSASVPDLGITGLFYHAISNNTCITDGEDMYCYTTGGPQDFVFSS